MNLIALKYDQMYSAVILIWFDYRSDQKFLWQLWLRFLKVLAIFLANSVEPVIMSKWFGIFTRALRGSILSDFYFDWADSKEGLCGYIKNLAVNQPRVVSKPSTIVLFTTIEGAFEHFEWLLPSAWGSQDEDPALIFFSFFHSTAPFCQLEL